MQDAVEAAYGFIRSAIFERSVEPGAHLVGAELAAQIGVSRTPVREALRRLHGEGLVVLTSNRGAKVAGLKIGEMSDIYGIRAVLEAYAAELATPLLSTAEIVQIAALAEELATLAVAARAAVPPAFVSRFVETNARLHNTVLDAAGSVRLAAMIRSLYAASPPMWTLLAYRDAELTRSVAHHRELASAFRARDPAWAAAVTRSHLLSARNAILASARTDPVLTEVDPPRRLARSAKGEHRQGHRENLPQGQMRRVKR